MRIAVRAVAMGLEPGERRAALDWVDGGGCIRAIAQLRGGEPCAFAVGHGGTRVVWTARPVLFLPLADRDGRRLPLCAGMFPTEAGAGGPGDG